MGFFLCCLLLYSHNQLFICASLYLHLGLLLVVTLYLLIFLQVGPLWPMTSASFFKSFPWFFFLLNFYFLYLMLDSATSLRCHGIFIYKMMHVIFILWSIFWGNSNQTALPPSSSPPKLSPFYTALRPPPSIPSQAFHTLANEKKI